MAAEAMAERLIQYFQSDRRGQQDHDPVDLEPPHQAPDVAMQVDEEQRREMPDRFLGTQLAESSPGEAAANRERQRDPLAGDECGDAGHRPDDRAGVRSRQQPGEKGSREREVGRLVVQQHTRDNPGGERQAEAGGEDEPLGPVALFGQENAAEPGEPDEHRGEHRHDGQLYHQGREQNLLGG
jgi:hypothetical protein